jgi:hypothetical protein
MKSTVILWVSVLVLAGTVLSAPAPTSAQTHYLEVTIPVEGSVAVRPPIATYEWHTVTGSSDPAELRWILLPVVNNDYNAALDYIRTTPGAPEWSPWTAYAPPGAGTEWTSPPQAFGPYVFAVQGRDASGVPETEFDFSRNARQVRVSNRTTGPMLVVDGDLIDPIITAITTTPVVEVEADGSVPVVFCWNADASAYGGVVAGYRYGWDVLDPDDDNDPGWTSSFVPFVQETECSSQFVPVVGTHTFTVEVIDNDGYKSRVVIAITFATVSAEEQSWGALKAQYRRE